MRSFALFGFLCFFISSFSQESLYKTGEIIDSILVSGTSEETFALYLPKQHKPAESSSIVFIFDPAARGKIGITPFINSAEKYNYILICSNNSKNGPYPQNFEIADRLFKHIFANFNIDEKRMYTSGFSGGSRLAAAIAGLSGAMQGVIGCGAGFSGNPLQLASKENSFSYAGLVGDRDMNYQEMLKANAWLTTMGIENEFFIYEDDHRWPPPEQLVRAFDWLELQAFKKGIKPGNDAIIQNTFLSDYSIASAFEKNNKISQAVAEYERVLRNYSAYFELDSIAAKTKSLKKTKLYKEEAKDRKRVTRLEDTLSSNFVKKFYADMSIVQSSVDIKWWKKQLKKLNETYIESERLYLQKMGKRLRYQLYALTIESFNAYVSTHAAEKARYCGQFLLLLAPDNPYFHYRLAQGYAQLNLVDTSLFHLEQALVYGWKDKEVLKNTKEFSSIRNHEKFKSLLEKN